jgi:hypothetical protein
MKALIPMMVVALLAACGGSDDDAKAKAPPPPKEGRPETQAIRNTQAVGVNGKAIADKIDSALTKSEEHNKDTEKKSEEETQ